MTNWRLFGEWALLFLFSAMVGVAALTHPWTNRVDASILDFLSQGKVEAPSDDIVIVEIDDRTLSETGVWPWDRSQHAKLTNAIAASAPSLIVYDILFLDPGSEEGDASLAQAIGDAGNVILPHSFVNKPNAITGMTAAMPVEPLASSARDLGHVAVFADADGIVRRFALSIEVDGRTYPHLAATALRQAFPEQELEIEGGDSPIIAMHPAGSFRSIPASEILAGRIPRSFIEGKVVLIGATAQGLGDRYATSAGEGQILAGVEIQANVLDGLLDDRMITEVSPQVTMLFLMGILATLSLSFWKLSPQWGLRAALAIIALVLVTSVSLLQFANIWLPITSTLLGIVIAYPLWGWRRLAAVSRFLKAEAEAFGARGGRVEQEGFDTVAQQVSLVKGLLGETRETLAFLRNIIAASPDPMLVFGKDGRLKMMNGNAEQIFGRQEEANGPTLKELFALKDGDTRSEQDMVRFANDQVFLVAEADLDIGDGGSIVALRDVTTFRQIEQQRREALEFLSNDMRSPQKAIIGLAQITKGAIDEEERLQRIEAQAEWTLGLTDQFVQIARLETQGLQRTETDIGKLLQEALDRAYPFARRKGITFDSHFRPGIHSCCLDTSMMSRVLDNLVVHAIDSSPELSQVVVEKARIGSERLQIRITDSGPGIASDPSQEPDLMRSEKDASVALGMRYVRKAVEKHGGEFSVEADPKHGTSYIIELSCAFA